MLLLTSERLNDKFSQLFRFMRVLVFAVVMVFPFGLTGAGSEYDPFGGYKPIHAGGKIYFYTAQIDGVWWLVTPGGNAFFSKGVNHVSYTADHRAEMGSHPYAEGMRDRYGSQGAWAENALQRLRRWGFNTLGAGSDKILHVRQMPYMLNLNFAWQHALGGGAPDVYSDDFRRMARRIARLQCKPKQDDMHLIGYFTDDHLNWLSNQSGSSLLNTYLSMPKDAPGRQQAMVFLRHHYHSLHALNRAWGVNLANYDQLSQLSPEPKTQARQKDEEAFLYQTARRYFEVCHNSIFRYDSNHLMLGVRFKQKPPAAVLRAMRNFVDAISVTGTAHEAFFKTLRRIYQTTQRPILVSDFIANDSPQSQKFTPANMQTFINKLIHLPFVAGYHLTEFADSINMADRIGLVAPDTTVRHDWIHVLQSANAQAETLHAQAQ